MSSDIVIPENTPRGGVAGVIIIAAAVLTIFAIAHHPSLHQRSPEALMAAMVAASGMDRFIHGSVIAIAMALVFCFAVLTIRRKQQTAVAAFIAFALGAWALIGAALIDGFLTPSIATHYVHALPADVKAGVHLLVLGALAIQVLAKFGLIAMSAGVLLWSAGLVRGTPVQIAVAALGIASSLGVVLKLAFAGHAIGPSLLGTIVLVQGVWYVAVGVLLLRRDL